MKPGEFITADTHFGHASVLRFMPRPFADVGEMDESLIARWNAKIPTNAVIYHLGDFSFANREKTEAILSRLNGRIRLVLGNHDRMTGGTLKRFEWAKDYYEARTPEKIKVVMQHYPLLSWNRGHHDAWCLHGHCHGGLADTGLRRMDVGVDTHPNYEPYSFEEVAAFMVGRGPHSHHDRSDYGEQGAG